MPLFICAYTTNLLNSYGYEKAVVYITCELVSRARSKVARMTVCQLGKWSDKAETSQQPMRTNPTHFGDPLTLHLAALGGIMFSLSNAFMNDYNNTTLMTFQLASAVLWILGLRFCRG